MRIVCLFLAILFLKQDTFSQWAANEDPLAIRELKLTRPQRKQIKQVNDDAAAKLKELKEDKNNSVEFTAGIEKINGSRMKRIRKILTTQQQIAWRKKQMEGKPRRGVTGLPNERIIQ